MPETPDVAVILTTHREGRLMIPTAHALERAVRAANETGLRVEVVITLDRSDDATVRAVRIAEESVLRSPMRITALEVDFGDLSLSRNAGVRATTARFVTVLDADNLMSKDWIVLAHALLSKQERPSVAHPARIVTFGERRDIWTLSASDDPLFRRGNLVWFNTWDAFSMADRRVLREHPYPFTPPSSGFGPEDWAWNCETVAAGVPHLIVASTWLFYWARGDASLAAAHRPNLLPRNSILRSQEVATEELCRLASSGKHRSLARNVLGRARQHSRAIDFGARGAAYLARPIRQRLSARLQPPAVSLIADDEPLVAEWAALHHLQPALPFPSTEALSRYGEWGHDWDAQFVPDRKAYWSAIESLPEDIEMVYIVPWMGTGGADLMTRQYIASVRRQRPTSKIALITTDPRPSTRLGDLDSSVVVFELGAFRLHHHWAVRVLAQVLAQLRPQTVHVINSTVGFDLVEQYGVALRSHSRLFVSTFVVDRLRDGSNWSFLYHRSTGFFESLSAILTDNHVIVDHMANAHGLDSALFAVHRQIVDEPFIDRSARSGHERLRVVWAGRFDSQKRLDRLATIAERLRDASVPVDLHFFGEPVIGDDLTVESSIDRLIKTGASRHAAYADGFSSIISEGFDALIMTSDWEGTPNVLLEAMSAGIPVVAPAVGDISRIIDPSTGYLIDDPSDVEAYVRALDSIRTGSEDARARAANARRLVETEFSVQAFDGFLSGLSGYLPSSIGTEHRAWRWYATPETRRRLVSEDDLVLLYTGSNGHSNFGDILQNKNAIAYWTVDRGKRPILFLPAMAGGSVERIASLSEWYGTGDIVFFSTPGMSLNTDALPSEMEPLSRSALLHVIGGGYLNAMWGDQHFAAIRAIASEFAGRGIVLTGLQFDASALPEFDRLVREHDVIAIGARDVASLEIGRTHLGPIVVDTFDDLTEFLLDWRGAESTGRARASGRVAVHMNTSDYAGGHRALNRWREVLRLVADTQPREMLFISSYTDERPDVRDTLRTIAALGESFPFEDYRVLDLAGAALAARRGEGLPESLADLRDVDFALCSSYHTALLMVMLGIPTYLVSANDYFSQKAELFKLSSLESFVAQPVVSAPGLGARLDTRAHWLQTMERLTS